MFLEGNLVTANNYNLRIKVIVEIRYCRKPTGRTCPVEGSIVSIGGRACHNLWRPVKIEGNPEHPGSLGAADVFAQANILEMYDPERSRSAARVENGLAADVTRAEALEALAAVMERHRGRRGAGLRILSEESSSSTMASLRARLAWEMPEARWHDWEPIARDQERDAM